MPKKNLNPFEVYTASGGGERKKPLEWEESAADTQSFVEGFHDADRSRPSMRFLWLVLLACFFMLGVKLFNLQIINGKSFRALSEGNRVRNQVVLAPRGLIRDRYGEVLAQNTASFNLVVVPFDLPKDGLDGEVDQLCTLFSLNKQDVMQTIGKVSRTSFEPVVIKQDLTADQNILFETKVSQFSGFDVQANPVRDYQDPEAFSHVLGYAGIISDTELAAHAKDNYYSNDYIGKSGIELTYEKYLRGQNGENQVEVDATGKLLKILGQDDPVPGHTLELNIDKGLQEQLYEGFQGRKGAAVAMNPKTGEVLALVSAPGFDSNLFAHGIKQDDYQKLLDDKNLPLFNRVLAGTYPPGSTVKPMVAVAALNDGIINQNTTINDTGNLVIPNQYNPALSYNFRGWKPGGLGTMDVRHAIAQSSDIFFYVTAGGYPHSQVPDGLGAQHLADWYRKFNLGQATGIDLQGEKSGTVPDPAWKASYYKNDPVLSKWYLGDTYHIGIGQGDLLVTPLQVSLWTAAIANNGTAYKPRVANKVMDQDGSIIYQTKPELLISAIAKPEAIKIVQEGMRETVLSGTGRQFNTLSVSSAGKTGTSQFDGSDPNRTHAWYTMYAPYENPQIVITVLVEAGGEGFSEAAPIAKKAFTWWIENRYNK